MKCKKCNREAEYDTPEELCEDHWAEWFAGGDLEYKKLILHDLKEMREKDHR